MLKSVNVLLFGNDSRLLETRRLVLESTGCKVYVSTALSTLSQILYECPIELLILCHTLTSEQCDSAEALAKALPRKVRVLALSAATLTSCEEAADAIANALDGPEALLETVDRLAGQADSA